MTTLMSGLSLPLQFLLVLLLCCVPASGIYFFKIHFDGLVACHPDQIEALAQFKNEFDSSSCNQTDYFNGVWCDNTTGLVTKLIVPSGCLSGTLNANSSLFRLHHLRYLNVSYNDFTSSSLPSGFGSLNKLEVLSLSSNGFIGQVPSSFNNLSKLSVLDLSFNELIGSFPFVRNLTKLLGLDLSNNHFSTLNPNSSLFGLHHLRFLDLSQNNFISSSVPFEFGKLNKLEVLSLSSNSFIGQVPSSFSNLSRLTELYLEHNDLTGSIQLVQNLTKLSILILAHNHFFGPIPSSLVTMPFLSYLDLRENHLTGSIEVPNSSFSSRLKFMYLGKNQFEGQILKPISKLINLKHLHLSFLNISYPINLSLFSSLKQLLYLDLSGNSISRISLSSNSGLPSSIEILYLSSCNISEFPVIVKTLKNLQNIDISNNIIKGIIPEWLWRPPRLSMATLVNNSFTGFEGSSEVLLNSSLLTLDFAYNSMTGEFPIPPLNIVSLSAWNNSFKGNIPLSVCNRSSLIVLDLSYNNFTGTIPPCLSNLKTVNLRKNNLEGSIPDEFSGGASTEGFDVGHNRLTGKLPRSFLNCSFLKFLSVDNNKIEDTFPFWLKALPSLQVFTLRSNRFFGHLAPPDEGPLAFPELRIFELSDNNFSGSLPPNYFLNWKASPLKINADGRIYMGDFSANYAYEDTIDLQYKGLFMEQGKVLTSYNTIDFSRNKLEGQIPESIGLLNALIALNLSNNAFTGHIPLSLANVTELESLDLSRNQLSGTIPNGLKTLSFLAYVNVSHNQLKGEIPQGTQITGQPKSSFEGNAGLCGLPLEERCFETTTPPIQQSKQEEEEEELISWKAVVIAYGPGVLLGLAIAQVVASYKPEWLVKIIGPNNCINR